MKSGGRHRENVTVFDAKYLLILLTSFKTILGGFNFSTITKVDHIPSIAKAICYLTCIKHAFKHPQTRTHLYIEPCRQTDTQADRHAHLYKYSIDRGQ